MSIIIAFLTKLGLGGMLSWISGGVFSSLAGIVVAAASEAIKVAGIVAKWVVETFIKGVDHIIKSVPAILVVLSLSWGSYGYAKWVQPVKTEIIERRVEVPASSQPRRETRTIFEELFGL